MSSFLDAALGFAARGFHVFPLRPGSKLPAIKAFPKAATRDEAQIRAWWAQWPDANIGISTSRFGDDQALVVVDVDNKGGKCGDDTLFELSFTGDADLPETWTQRTPTGGRHLVFRAGEPVKQGAGVLGAGLDVRSRGGYIVGAGSVVAAGAYERAGSTDVAKAPAWLIERCGKVKEKGSEASPAAKRAIHYLKNEAPTAVEDAAGDDTTYKVAAKVKDFGIDEPTCVLLLLNHWNDRCAPPWPLDELQEKVANAYRYGQEPIGASAPETQFTAITAEIDDEDIHPFEKLNRDFAFIVNNGQHHILYTGLDIDGRPTVQHWSVETFHARFAPLRMTIGDGKTAPVTKLWIADKGRREYDGLCFRPQRLVPARYFNLWRGFAVEPIGRDEAHSEDAQRGLDMFLAHALDNVCRGDAEHCRWLISYFAQLVQRPWEKPLTALVFRGGKGVGKNALIERIGHLLGVHFLLTSSRRYLVGNFNGHLENLLLFTLDEAFWSGDKQAEGTLKDLVTGSKHVIERKGHEPYSVENCLRLVIIGNEEWLVPASQDERRYAVFDVGEGRKQDRDFFRVMRELMEAGGYRLLLRYLLDYDISGVDLNQAPQTDALMDQKVQSLDPFYQWWLGCLHEGELAGCEFHEGWPAQITKQQFCNAYQREVGKGRNVRNRLHDSRQVGKLLKKCLPSVDAKQKDKDKNNVYRLPSLDVCRAEWSTFIGHAVVWE